LGRVLLRESEGLNLEILQKVSALKHKFQRSLHLYTSSFFVLITARLVA